MSAFHSLDSKGAPCDVVVLQTFQKRLSSEDDDLDEVFDESDGNAPQNDGDETESDPFAFNPSD